MKYIIFLCLLCFSCRSTKKVIGKTSVADHSATLSSFDSGSTKEIKSTTTTAETNDVIVEEFETGGNDFPADADTSNQVVKILKSLPKGSKFKRTIGKTQSIVERHEIGRDSSFVHFKDSTAHDSTSVVQMKDVEKTGSSFGGMIALVVGGLGLIVATIWYFQRKERKEENKT
jgi:hypothetical protein